ncbi:MAG: hypothetical protein ABI895_38235 [Deltaproteobacteria bacterium]
MSRRFYYARVSVLSLVLLGVLGYAMRDHARRSARRDWQRPLQIALVLLLEGEVDPGALGLFQERVGSLEEALEREFGRYGGTFRPIRFRQFGPAPEPGPPPTLAAEPSLWQSLTLSLSLGAFARASDRAAGVDNGAFDGKIYVRLSTPRSPRRSLVEGLGEDGGRIAVTRLELRDDSADFGLFVVAHELFHLLGANDRYGPDGFADIPDGLGEPEREPRYPQRSVEVMARGRVLEPGREQPPSQLDELRVGTRTASEIGWSSLTAAASEAGAGAPLRSR